MKNLEGPTNPEYLVNRKAEIWDEFYTNYDKLTSKPKSSSSTSGNTYDYGKNISNQGTGNANDTVFKNIDALSSLAGKYSNDKSLTNWLVFMYIRQFNKDYTTSTWDMAGGKLDSKFIEYVKKENPKLAKYFAGSVNIIDPSSNEKIEITHWAAVLSVLTHDTTWSDAGIKSWAGEGNIDNLGGWAGDLQTLIIDVLKDTKNSNDYKALYKSASALMGDPNKSFSMTDLLADVDAVNINDLLGSSSLGSAMRSYYVSGYKTRYTSFVKSITGSTKKKV